MSWRSLVGAGHLGPQASGPRVVRFRPWMDGLVVWWFGVCVSPRVGGGDVSPPSVLSLLARRWVDRWGRRQGRLDSDGFLIPGQSPGVWWFGGYRSFLCVRDAVGSDSMLALRGSVLDSPLLMQGYTSADVAGVA